MQKRTSNIKMLTMQALSSILPMPHSFLDSNDFTLIPTKFYLDFNSPDQIYHDHKGNFEEQEFSFACTDPQETLVFADEIFHNGQIRPIFPVFDQSLLLTTTHDNDASYLQRPLKKLTIEEHKNFHSKSSGISKEPHNKPSQKKTMVMEASNECYEKSNSTGFSKLRRFRRDLKLWSNNDSKDAFVFLNPQVLVKSDKAVENNVIKKRKGGKHKMTRSAHEKLYVMNRMRKESNKRKSFLPYRQQLLGLFTNVNGLSKNIHPF